MKDIGAGIRKIRKKYGFTQETIADLMSWSIRKVSMIENNRQDISHMEYLQLMETINKSKKIASFTYQRSKEGKPAIFIKR